MSKELSDIWYEEMKKYKAIFLSVIFLFASGFFCCLVLAQESVQEQKKAETAEDKQMITGLVMEIAEDCTHIIVDNKKILTSSKFIESSELKIGDRVHIVARETEKGLVIFAIQFNYKIPPKNTGLSEEQKTTY